MNKKEILKKLDEMLSKAQFSETNAGKKEKTKTVKQAKVKKKKKLLRSKGVKK